VRLETELPSILHWALEGLDRLRARGYFRQPASAQEIVDQLATLASPVREFASDRCTVSPTAGIGCTELYQAWVSWCADSGREQSGTIQIFGRNVAAAFPEVRRVRPRTGGAREWRYVGIGLARS
jgi:putative DNA primase/helicase